MTKTKQQKEYNTLLSVLANGSTESARQLLKKHSGQDATDTKDLEVKLARVYALSPMKIDIEKEFASIHPHKDFILKYLQPKQKPIQKEEKKEKEVVSEVYLNAEGHAPCGNPNCPKCAKYFNYEGLGSMPCRQRMSNCCGCSGFNGYSNADGQNQSVSSALNNPQTVLVLGLVSIVAIFGMVTYLNKSSR